MALWSKDGGSEREARLYNLGKENDMAKKKMGFWDWIIVIVIVILCVMMFNPSFFTTTLGLSTTAMWIIAAILVVVLIVALLFSPDFLEKVMGTLDSVAESAIKWVESAGKAAVNVTGYGLSKLAPWLILGGAGFLAYSYIKDDK